MLFSAPWPTISCPLCVLEKLGLSSLFGTWFIDRLVMVRICLLYQGLIWMPRSIQKADRTAVKGNCCFKFWSVSWYCQVEKHLYLSREEAPDLSIWCHIPFRCKAEPSYSFQEVWRLYCKNQWTYGSQTMRKNWQISWGYANRGWDRPTRRYCLLGPDCNHPSRMERGDGRYVCLETPAAVCHTEMDHEMTWWTESRKSGPSMIKNWIQADKKTSKLVQSCRSSERNSGFAGQILTNVGWTFGLRSHGGAKHRTDQSFLTPHQFCLLWCKTEIKAVPEDQNRQNVRCKCYRSCKVRVYIGDRIWPEEWRITTRMHRLQKAKSRDC